MSIANRIQEMETHIGDVYDTIDYSYDTTGVNKNIINIPKYLKKGYIDIINNGTDTLYSNFPKVSGIGSNLSLTPTYEAPMKLNEIQGDTLQDGTPTPDSPVPIQSVTGLQRIKVQNKNLFNLTQNNTTYNNVTTQYKGSEFILNGTTSGSANIISLDSANLYSVGTLKAGTYAFTLITNSGYNANEHNSAFYLRKSDFNLVKSRGIFANDNFTDTFILEEDTELFVQIYSNSGNIVFNDFHMYFQIELGSTATTFVAHQEQNFELNLGNIELCKIGTYQDYIYKSNGNWYLHKEIGKVVLDGSENITNPSNTGYSNTILRFNITVADKKYGKSGTIVDDILSNNFTCEKLDYDARTSESVAGHAAEHIVIIFIDKSRLSTENVQGFKTWLSTHNTMVYYVLATPTDTLITNTELIEDLETLYTAKSQEGTTNISITSEDLEMILNVSALEGDA